MCRNSYGEKPVSENLVSTGGTGNILHPSIPPSRSVRHNLLYQNFALHAPFSQLLYACRRYILLSLAPSIPGPLTTGGEPSSDRAFDPQFPSETETWPSTRQHSTKRGAHHRPAHSCHAARPHARAQPPHRAQPRLGRPGARQHQRSRTPRRRPTSPDAP